MILNSKYLKHIKN